MNRRHTCQKNGKSKKYIMIGMVILILLFILIMFFTKKHDKSFNFGNNTISKTTEGITQHILNMSSYEAKIEVNISSNKNKTKYEIEQQYVSPNLAKQVVKKPDNIENLTTIFDGQNLKIENTKLNLATIYENYQGLTDNHLFLNYFVEDYNNCDKAKAEEKEGMIIMQTATKNTDNKYRVSKKLYIDKNTAKPVKMEVQDVNQNITVYILYNEININSTKKEEIVAFRWNPILSNI